LSQPALVRFGLNPDAPISTFVKRLRCSKCGWVSRDGNELPRRPRVISASARFGSFRSY
jgi:hypothetical protein